MEIDAPSDVAFSLPVITEEDKMKKIVTKANEKHEHQIIVYVFQEVLQYLPKKLLGNAANILKAMGENKTSIAMGKEMLL
eukprot:3415961-Ditylum_brightwellii.AAC.1